MKSTHIGRENQKINLSIRSQFRRKRNSREVLGTYRGEGGCMDEYSNGCLNYNRRIVENIQRYIIKYDKGNM